MSLIITIGRQFGSGGRDGEKVARMFNIPFMTRSLLNLYTKREISAKRR